MHPEPVLPITDFPIRQRLAEPEAGPPISARVELLRAAGTRLGNRLPDPTQHVPGGRQLRARTNRLRDDLRRMIAKAATSDEAAMPGRTWITDNARLVSAAEREAREFVWSTPEMPAVVLESGLVPRVAVIAETYCDETDNGFDDATLVAFLQGLQDVHDLELGELWAMRPALMLALLDRLLACVAEPGDCPAHVQIPRLIDSIRHVSEADWSELFTSVSLVDAVLARDPARAYLAMEKESRDAYRHVVSYLAKHSTRNERQVAEAAIELAAATAPYAMHSGDVAATRRAHVGYYLVDRGVAALRARVGVKLPRLHRLALLVREHPAATYLGGIAFVTLAIVVLMLSNIDVPTSAVVASLLLLLPATQVAVELINGLVPVAVRPRALPRLDFSDGIPAEYRTLVAVPTLLLHERQVHELVMDLEIRYLANRDPHLHFALVTDSVDAEQPDDSLGDPLVPLAESLVRGLNERYGTTNHTPFYLLHRHRIYNPSEKRWMGWERKRGKLLDLNRLLRGRFDAFPVKVGRLETLRAIRYVITLDSDTQLPRDAAHRLVGTLAHPLNRAVVDPGTKMVVEGYGILQPRIGISTHSASQSWLASLLSGQTGFDIYTRAVSDAYQDLFGEGSFTGKGIYDVDAFMETLETRFPDNALLSHDLIEGAFARAGLVSDIELIDDYPTHFSAYTRRKHRWMRGDWQILRWLMTRVPDAQSRLVLNPLSVVSRWKIADNLRRSLFEPATLLLLLAGWFIFPASAWLWTALTVAILLMPAYAALLVAMTRAPWGRRGFGLWFTDTMRTFGRQHLMALLTLTFLLHDALLAIDAIARSLARVFVTRQRLLEWETAAEAKEAAGPRRAADFYLEALPVVAAGLLLVLGVARGPAFLVAAPVIGLWILAAPLAAWLSRPPRSSALVLQDSDERWLGSQAVRMWRYFREFSTPERHALIPDHVREDGLVAERLSPTNLGFLLNARIAAVHLGYLTVPEFLEQTRHTLDGAAGLPWERGHLVNWAATDTREALEPRFVSTVDSGNLAACLWTLKQAALAFAQQPPDADRLWTGICAVARELDSLEHPAGRVLAERILRTGPDWREALPTLEELAGHLLSAASDEDVRWWAGELVDRIVRTRRWLATGMTADLQAGLETLAADADRLVSNMQFAFLYNPRKKTLSVGYDAGADRLEASTYDLLASEARIAAFVAIAKGDAPQESWFHLGRTHVISSGERVLSSWTGTMFEYLMPALWMRQYPRTIMYDSMRAIVRLQQKYTRWRRVPWGISESAHVGVDPAEPGYAAFGLPDVALKRMDAKALVISPYASFLALLVDPREALRNLYEMERLGWSGRYGLYEAVDYSGGEPIVVRSWMAHHLGMSLLAVCQTLCGPVMQQHFHAEPQVLATELLLHERVPPRTVAETEQWLPHPASEVQTA